MLQKRFMSDPRIRGIIEYISKHQGCNKQAVVKALENGKISLSRGPVYGTLRDLIKLGVIENMPTNERDNALYIKDTNPFVVAKREIDTFEELYFEIMNQIAAILKKRLFAAKPVKFAELAAAMVRIFYFQTDRIFFLARIEWSPTIPDRNTRKEFLGMVFERLIELEMKLIGAKEAEDLPRSRVTDYTSFLEYRKDQAGLESSLTSLPSKIDVLGSQFQLKGFRDLVDMLR